MKTSLVKIGNSRGIRIPKSFIEEAELGDMVELEISKKGLIIKKLPTSVNEEALFTEKALSEWLNEDEENAWKNL